MGTARQLGVIDERLEEKSAAIATPGAVRAAGMAIGE